MMALLTTEEIYVYIWTVHDQCSQQFLQLQVKYIRIKNPALDTFFLHSLFKYVL